jgi:phospho-N-acetylmuramoyl-pentapeptide-transferase
MLYHFSQWIAEYNNDFSVFQYITLRAILATISALIISWVLGPWTIAKLVNLRFKQAIREDGPQAHLKKTGTPTMGGVLIISAIAISSLLWADLSNPYYWVALGVTIGFSLVGFVDDFLKIKHNNSKGISVMQKYFSLSLIAIIAATLLYSMADGAEKTDLLIPYGKDLIIPIGILFIPLAYFVMLGASNGVNLTDGLDGLAILPTAMIASALAIFAYVSGHFHFAEYLRLPFIAGNGEIAIFCCSIVGAGLGFLWFNAYPAQLFMGDVGALGLGGALGIVAIIVRQELVFFIMAGIFVIETLSVMLQVGSYKLRGKRLFLMAPIHHHFELKGWAEPKIIVRFWIITLILVLVGLASLKIR